MELLGHRIIGKGEDGAAGVPKAATEKGLAAGVILRDRKLTLTSPVLASRDRKWVNEG